MLLLAMGSAIDLVVGSNSIFSYIIGDFSMYLLCLKSGLSSFLLMKSLLRLKLLFC